MTLTGRSMMLEEGAHLREALATATTFDHLKAVTQSLEDHFLPYHAGDKLWSSPPDGNAHRLPFYPWLCQPYVRPAPEEHLKKMDLIRAEMKRARDEAAEPEAPAEGAISKKKLKKMARNSAKRARVGRQPLSPCSVTCPNPMVRKYWHFQLI